MTPQRVNRRKSTMPPSFGLLFALFRTLLIFAAVTTAKTTFNIASHNLHGFKKSAAFHKQCLDKFGGLWFGQEIWLPENRLSELCNLFVQFVARSGMEKAVSSGIMRGRPYGSVSIACSPNLDHVIRPLVNYRHGRIVCVEPAAEPNIHIQLYMPYFDASKRQECTAETVETIAMLEEILSDHSLHKIVIGGDF